VWCARACRLPRGGVPARQQGQQGLGIPCFCLVGERYRCEHIAGRGGALSRGCACAPAWVHKQRGQHGVGPCLCVCASLQARKGCMHANAPDACALGRTHACMRGRAPADSRGSEMEPTHTHTHMHTHTPLHARMHAPAQRSPVLCRMMLGPRRQAPPVRRQAPPAHRQAPPARSRTSQRMKKKAWT